jgi:DNA ligase (NAD+)
MNQTYKELFDDWFARSIAHFGPVAETPGGVDIYLIDAENNPFVQKNKIIEVMTRLNVTGLKQGNVDKLHAAGLTTASSIITASKNQLQAILGESAGETVYKGLRSSLSNITLANLAGSSQTLGRGIGRRRMKALTDVYPDIKDLTIRNIAAIDGFDQITAKAIVSNLPHLLAFLESIKGYYTLAEPKIKTEGGSLTGQTFVFTGFRSKEAELTIEEKGGKIGSGVSKDTTYLVTKDPNSTSSKITKALTLGVKVIGPKELNELIA